MKKQTCGDLKEPSREITHIETIYIAADTE